MRRKQLGDFGEQVAAAHLVRQGMALVARKWRCAGGEIDLVMREHAMLVFVEVRTRRASGAEESVGRHKQGRLAALAYAYLDTLGVDPHTPWRIDVVAIDIDRHGRVARLAHIRDAVEER